MSDRGWLVPVAAIGAAGVIAGLTLPPAIGSVGAGLLQASASHLALAFPNGRPRSRAGLLVVVAGHVLFPLTGLARPPVHMLAGLVASVIVMAFMFARWRASSDVLRRILAPVLVGAAVALLVLAIRGPGGTPSLVVLGAVALPAGVLVGRLRTRLDRAAVAGLVTELSVATGRSGLEQALARSMRDTSL